MASTVLGDSVIHQLVNAEKQIDLEIKKGEQALDDMRLKRDQLHTTIQTFNVGPKRGFGLHTNLKAKPSTKRKVKINRSPGKRKQGQMTLRGVRQGATTMDMVRQVLNNAGKELEPEVIREHIIRDFGVQPASSMTQMLYKRSRKDSSFYRLANGTYGLLDWKNTAKANAA